MTRATGDGDPLTPEAGDALMIRAASDDDANQRWLAARDVVAQLQEALLPTALPLFPQARIAARYMAAGREQLTGGDWFDAIPLAGGTVGLLVGDVVGHGIGALAAMSQLRAVLAELLTAETDLAIVLGRVDGFAARTPALRAATLVLAVLDPAAGALRYVTCGHPAPVIVSKDGTVRFLTPTDGGPLGIGSLHALATDTLRPGDLLLLYSDGLVNRPGRTLAAGMTDLAAAAGDAALSPVLPCGERATAAERLCELTVESLTRSGYADDVAALAAERLQTPVPAVHLELPSQVTSLTVIRRALHRWLGTLDLLAEDQDGVHIAVVETVTNAIVHAYPAGEPGPIEFDLRLMADGQLECLISDYGTWHLPDPRAADRGNGLMVAQHMVDELFVSHPAREDGAPPGAPSTVVRLLHRVRHPAILDFGTGVDLPAIPPEPPFAVETALAGAGAGARVQGPVDFATADEFLRRLLAACRGGTLPLTVDLTDVSHLASAGVSALYRLARQLVAHGNRLELVAPDGSPAQAMLDLVGLPHAARRNSAMRGWARRRANTARLTQPG